MINLRYVKFITLFDVPLAIGVGFMCYRRQYLCEFCSAIRLMDVCGNPGLVSDTNTF